VVARLVNRFKAQAEVGIPIIAVSAETLLQDAVERHKTLQHRPNREEVVAAYERLDFVQSEGDPDIYARPGHKTSDGARMANGPSEADIQYDLDRFEEFLEQGYWIRFGADMSSPRTNNAGVWVHHPNPNMFRHEQEEGFMAMDNIRGEMEIVLSSVVPSLLGEGRGLGRSFIGTALLLASAFTERSKYFVVKDVVNPKLVQSLKQLKSFRVGSIQNEDGLDYVWGRVPQVADFQLQRLMELNERNKFDVLGARLASMPADQYIDWVRQHHRLQYTYSAYKDYDYSKVIPYINNHRRWFECRAWHRFGCTGGQCHIYRNF